MALNISNNNIISCILQIADTNLILAQRNASWCGHGPVLEQDIAITNLTLDLLGQARNFYQYAADLLNVENGNNEATEDSLAYERGEREYKNLLLAEQENGDWAQTISRQFFYSIFLQIFYTDLQNSSDKRLAGIAVKSLKELNYHVPWCSDWVIRLGDGTEESKKRMQNAVDALWTYTGEMFLPAQYEIDVSASENWPPVSKLKDSWTMKIKEVLEEATLEIPSETSYMQTGGKTGTHTEKLGFILAEMQYLPRMYPKAEW